MITNQLIALRISGLEKQGNVSWGSYHESN